MSIKAQTSFSLKDDLFNKQTVTELARHLEQAAPGFKYGRFVREVTAEFEKLELKQRIHWIVSTMAKHLPERFPDALAILKRALPEPLDPGRSDDDFGHFIWVVPGEYVARYGCTAEHADDSLDFLREATKRFSSEFAVRPFLRDFPDKTIQFLAECAGDDNYHVRRLASEGVRPYLPWGLRVELPPRRILPILDRLHGDPTRFVTRSVTNTLNDLSRDHPALVITQCKKWQRSKKQDPVELDWMLRNALRTLLKQDNPQALALIGYTLKPQFKLTGLAASKVVELGEAFELQCSLLSTRQQQLRVTLTIGYLKANGEHAEKVFSVFDGAAEKGQVLQVKKRQPFRPMTTRTLYPGKHFAQLVVNGVASKRLEFELKPG